MAIQHNLRSLAAAMAAIAAFSWGDVQYRGPKVARIKPRFPGVTRTDATARNLESDRARRRRWAGLRQAVRDEIAKRRAANLRYRNGDSRRRTLNPKAIKFELLHLAPPTVVKRDGDVFVEPAHR